MISRFPKALVILLAAGCGASTPPDGEVSGTVSYRGQPVRGGIITFVSDRGVQTSAVIDPIGHYQMKAPSGAMKVTVNNLMLRKGQADARLRLKQPAGTTTDGPTVNGTYVPIPQKYLSAEQSGLAWTVRPGTQTYDIPL